jgi:anti-sigma-K factor RskA
VTKHTRMTRLPTRSPPLARQRQALLAAFLRALVADVLGGEAEEAASYTASLPKADRKQAAARREERAKKVHRLVRHTLFWADVLLAVIAIAIITVIAVGTLAIFFELDAADTPLLVKIAGPTAGVGFGTWKFCRRRLRKK